MIHHYPSRWHEIEEPIAMPTHYPFQVKTCTNACTTDAICSSLTLGASLGRNYYCNATFPPTQQSELQERVSRKKAIQANKELSKNKP